MTDIPALRLAIAAAMATSRPGAGAAEVCRLCVAELPVNPLAHTDAKSPCGIDIQPQPAYDDFRRDRAQMLDERRSTDWRSNST